MSTPGSDPPGAGFIAFEGVEGCGKSTQIERLADHLIRQGRSILVTREPGGTPLGDALRGLLLSPASSGIDGETELFLLSASRRAHVTQTIRPALARGQIVICDRFADSSVAYQGGARGLGLEVVERINALATGGLMPQATVLLDLDPAVGLARVGRRGRAEDRMEREALAFHRRVRETYLLLAERRGEEYCRIDASASPDQVFAEILAYLAPILGIQTG